MRFTACGCTRSWRRATWAPFSLWPTPWTPRTPTPAATPPAWPSWPWPWASSWASRTAFLRICAGAPCCTTSGRSACPTTSCASPRALTEEEWAVVRQHPVIGAQILAPVPKLAVAAGIVRHHHEWYDGRGYPDGLAGEDIPLGGRILAVVDAYGAITDERAYKHSRSHEEAVAELRELLRHPVRSRHRGGLPESSQVAEHRLERCESTRTHSWARAFLLVPVLLGWW